MTGRHPAFEVLADLAEGRRRGPAAAAAAGHAAACAPCAAAVAFVERTLPLLAGGAALEPPARALRAAFRIPAAARRSAFVEGVRTLIARLVFDSLAAPAPALALRGAAVRQRLFRAGPWEVEVLRAGRALRGSVVPAEEGEGDPPPVRGGVRLLRGRRTVAAADLDPRGRFSLGEVPGGTFTLVLAVDGTEIRVEDLDL